MGCYLIQTVEHGECLLDVIGLADCVVLFDGEVEQLLVEIRKGMLVWAVVNESEHGRPEDMLLLECDEVGLFEPVPEGGISPVKISLHSLCKDYRLQQRGQSLKYLYNLRYIKHYQKYSVHFLQYLLTVQPNFISRQKLIQNKKHSQKKVFVPTMSSKQPAIPNQLLPWLSTLPAEHIFLGSQEIYEFENGLLVSQVLKLLVEDYRHKWMGGNSPAMRASNWNVIMYQPTLQQLTAQSYACNIQIGGLQTLGIEVTSDQNTLIVGGDREAAMQVVYKLRDLSMRLKKQNEVDISKIDMNKDIRQSQSLLQLLILALGKSFGLSAKEAVTLLSNDGKYLAHILAKGLRGEFPPVYLFYSQITNVLKLLVSLSKDKQSKEFVLKILKPGTISKSENVAHLCMDLISEYLKFLGGAISLDIFKAQFVSTCLLSLRRHSSLMPKAVQLLLNQTQYNSDTLQLIRKNTEATAPYNFEQVQIYAQIYRQAIENNRVDQVESMKGFDLIVKSAVDEILKNVRPSSMNVTLVLTILQGGGGQMLGESPVLRIVEKCLKNVMSKNTTDRINGIVLAFQILYVLASTKNRLAPQIYKIILNAVPDFISKEEGELFFRNLKAIITQFPRIPLFPLLETLAANYHQQQEQNTGLEPSPAEVQIILHILNSEDLQTKTALIGLNLLTKLQLNSVMNAEQFSQTITSTIRRFAHQDIVREIANKFIKITLAIFYANQKKKYDPKKKNARQNKETPADILLKLKNIVIFRCLDSLLGLKDENINQTAFPLIAFTVIQLKMIGPTRHHLLQKLLKHFGDTPEDVLRDFQTKNQQQQQLQRQQAAQELEAQEARNKASEQELNLKTPVKINRYNSQSHSEKELTGSKVHQSQIISGHGNSYYVRNSATASKVAEKVVQGLQKYHRSYLKKVQKIENEEKQKAEEQQRRVNLKKTLELRMMQQGLAFKSEQQPELLFEFDTKQKAMKLQKPAKYKDIPYFDVELEQDRDIKALEYTMKRYHKVIRFLYVKYSNCTIEGKILKDFDEFAQKSQTIKAGDVWKLFKEHSLDEYITASQCQELVRNVNIKLGNKSDVLGLQFSAFEKFLVQASLLMFSRPPKDLRCNPMAMQVEQLFRLMRDKCEKNGMSTQLFDDPDTAYFNQGEVIKELNRKLAENPDHILPEGYKKITTRKIEFQYGIFLEAIGPAYKECYQIIDELLFSEFNVHLVEPFTKITTKAKARPALFQMPKLDQLDNTTNQGSTTDRMRSRSEHQVKLSHTLRGEVAKFPILERPTATRVAGVLEEILVAVELGHDRIGLKLENQAVKQKKEREEQTRRRMQEEQTKRRQRQESLKKKVEQVKDKKQQKQKQKEEEKKKEIERKKQQEEKRKQKEKELKQKLAQYQTKKKQEQEKTKQQEEEKKKHQEEQEAKKKKQLEEQKRKLEEAKKKKEEEEQARKEKEEQEQKTRKAYEEKLFREKQKALKLKIEEHKKQKQKQGGEDGYSLKNSGLINTSNSKVLDSKLQGT